MKLSNATADTNSVSSANIDDSFVSYTRLRSALSRLRLRKSFTKAIIVIEYTNTNKLNLSPSSSHWKALATASAGANKNTSARARNHDRSATPTLSIFPARDSIQADRSSFWAISWQFDRSRFENRLMKVIRSAKLCRLRPAYCSDRPRPRPSRSITTRIGGSSRAGI